MGRHVSVVAVSQIMTIKVGKVYISHISRIKITRIKGDAIYYQHFEPGIEDTREYSIPRSELEYFFHEELDRA